MRSLVLSSNLCIQHLKFYFKNDSICVTEFRNSFNAMYDIFNNDLQALHSRIGYIQQRENVSNLYLFIQ